MDEGKKKKYDATSYMREYRASGRDKSSKVQTRARNKAVKWVRSTYPEQWEQFLAESRREIDAST